MALFTNFVLWSCRLNSRRVVNPLSGTPRIPDVEKRRNPEKHPRKTRRDYPDNQVRPCENKTVSGPVTTTRLHVVHKVENALTRQAIVDHGNSGPVDPQHLLQHLPVLVARGVVTVHENGEVD